MTYIVGVAGLAAAAWAVWPEQKLGVVVMAGAAIVLGWLISRASARRLRRSISGLRQAAEAVGSGDFSKRVTCEPGDQLAKLVHAFNRMADRLEQMAAEDAGLRAKLARSERLAAIGELAATVAHEVNNPLDGIQNCTRIMRRNLHDTQQVHRLLDMMDSGLYRIEMIVRRLLSLSRDTAMNVVPMLLDDVINDALLFVQPRLDKHRVELVRSPCERPAFALADRVQMTQAVINLLLNALDSVGPGGRITLAIEPHDADGTVRLVVEDNGAGIAPEHLAHIFEPFYSTKRAGGGTGLGLAVVHRIVEAHHGRIDVESRLGVGTRFAIALPAAKAAPFGHVSWNLESPAAAPPSDVAATVSQGR